MDASNLEGQVHALATLLTKKLEPSEAVALLRQNFANDAVLDTGAYTANNADEIVDAVALHSHFTKNATVSKTDWDEQNKIAHFQIKLSYALPLDKIPFPLSIAVPILQKIQVPLEWNKVQVQLGADEDVPGQSEATEAARYHVKRIHARPTKISNPILNIITKIIVFFVSPFVRLIVRALIPVMKFFHRHPLTEGIIKAWFFAVYELAFWGWNVFTSVIHALIPVAEDVVTKAEDPDKSQQPNVDIRDSPVTSPAPLRRRFVNSIPVPQSVRVKVDVEASPEEQKQEKPPVAAKEDVTTRQEAKPAPPRKEEAHRGPGGIEEKHAPAADLVSNSTDATAKKQSNTNDTKAKKQPKSSLGSQWPNPEESIHIPTRLEPAEVKELKAHHDAPPAHPNSALAARMELDAHSEIQPGLSYADATAENADTTTDHADTATLSPKSTTHGLGLSHVNDSQSTLATEHGTDVPATQSSPNTHAPAGGASGSKKKSKWEETGKDAVWW